MKLGPGKIDKRSLFEIHSEKFRQQLSGLDTFSLTIYEHVCNYIEWNEPDGVDTATTAKIVDLNRPEAEVIWGVVDSLGRSKRADQECAWQLEWLLTGLSSDRLSWEYADRHSQEEQTETVEKIGKLASDLAVILANAKKGYVSDFLGRWGSTGARQPLEIEDFTKSPSPQLRVLSAWYWQKEMNQRKDRPLWELLVHLNTLTKAARIIPSTFLVRSLE